MSEKVNGLMSALVALAYCFMGGYLILNPMSNIAQMVFANEKWVIALGILVFAYGAFRGFRAYQKLKNQEKNDDNESYQYYDDSKK
jgi:positive regulator of sigma E activity